MSYKSNQPLNTGLISLIAISTLIGLPAIAQQSAADAALPGQVPPPKSMGDLGRAALSAAALRFFDYLQRS